MVIGAIAEPHSGEDKTAKHKHLRQFEGENGYNDWHTLGMRSHLASCRKDSSRYAERHDQNGGHDSQKTKLAVQLDSPSGNEQRLDQEKSNPARHRDAVDMDKQTQVRHAKPAVEIVGSRESEKDAKCNDYRGPNEQFVGRQSTRFRFFLR
jgi:hypothetical protein